MKQVVIKDAVLRAAALQGPEAFLDAVLAAVRGVAGGELTEDALQLLNAEQLTLWGFDVLREEVSVGGFVQLIYNGYGPFVFGNPLALALKRWGLRDLSKMLYEAGKLYRVHGAELAVECDEDEFMALYERFPDFDVLDDEFVEHEEEWVRQVAAYVDENLDHFAIVDNGNDKI